MAQLPEFNALTPAAQAMVMQGYSFDVAIATAAQQAADAVAAAQGDAGVLVVTAHEPVLDPKGHRVGRTPGPGQLPQFSALPAKAQQQCQLLAELGGLIVSPARVDLACRRGTRLAAEELHLLSVWVRGRRPA